MSKYGTMAVKIDGSVSNKDKIAQQFQTSKKIKIAFVNMKAGGVGLNLTAADTVIHFDPWWNPATEAQASDRAYRIGQTKPVTIYKLIARGSVEEKIQHLQQHKAALAESILTEGSSTRAALDHESIEALLAPLEG